MTITTIHFHNFFIIPNLLSGKRDPFAYIHQRPIGHKQELASKSQNLLQKWSTSRVTGELVLKDLAPDDFQGMNYSRGKSLIMVTKEVRVMFSTDWLALG